MMPPRPLLRSFILPALLAGSLGAGALTAHAAPTSAKAVKDYQDRRDSVSALHNAYRAGGGDAALQAQVAGALADAQKKADGGDPAAARQVLDGAYRDLTRALAAMKSGTGAPAGAAVPTRTDPNGPRTPELIRRDLNSTATLLEALKRQQAEKHADKPADIATIQAELSEGEAAYAAQDWARADRLAHAAYDRAKAAIAGLQTPAALKSGSAAMDAQLNAQPERDTPALRDAYRRRESSVAALLDAAQREPKPKPAVAADLADVKKLLARAQDDARQGQYPRAIGQLDQAYQRLKQIIKTQRQGQSATASKHFASADDEFRHEHARNDDYMNLITHLGDRGDAGWLPALENSRALRGRAEDTAKTGDWVLALRDINDSTLELKKLLRQAGFPIQ